MRWHSFPNRRPGRRCETQRHAEGYRPFARFTEAVTGTAAELDEAERILEARRRYSVTLGRQAIVWSTCARCHELMAEAQVPA